MCVTENWQQVFDSLKAQWQDWKTARDSVWQNHPEWKEPRDIRGTVVTQCLIAVESTKHGVECLGNYLAHPNTWKGSGPRKLGLEDPELEQDVSLQIQNFGMFLKFALLHTIFSVVENAMRQIVRAIDPEACARGAAAFQNIYDYLLKRLDLNRHRPFFNLLRCLRNTIHNNGAYFHRSGKDQRVEWRGRKYLFKHGRYNGYTSWRDLDKYLSELRKALLDIVEMSGHAVTSHIPDLLDDAF